ncbi:hypothetical protein BDP27DRAFT_1339893 [Rhodocollybia butyracea]|uniref:Uncharacterized protein n=1 Tax=Rhodocollybia butyracea TaxID=206335 RepID=A0A9P5PBT8_9AGAR|nr:hypothetical protein BDP27DRAFT_1339893 [Rhodocollybia butyracea]
MRPALLLLAVIASSLISVCSRPLPDNEDAAESSSQVPHPPMPPPPPPPADLPKKYTLTFLDHTGQSTNSDQVSTGIEHSLGLKYRGVYETHKQNLGILYFKLIGGNCNPCFGWAARGPYYLALTGSLSNRRPIYYIGIRHGTPGPNQFEDFDQCFAVNPKRDSVARKAKEVWNQLRDAVNSVFMAPHPPLLLPGPLPPPQRQPAQKGYTVTFLDHQTAQPFRRKKSITNAINKALGTVNAGFKVNYLGVYAPHAQNGMLYFKLIGGPRCNPCFGWQHQLLVDSEYYTGIIHGGVEHWPHPNQFEDQHHCVGYHPHVARALARWNTLKVAANSAFMIEPSTIHPPAMQPPTMQPPTMTFMTLQGQILSTNHDTAVQQAITNVIREIFQMPQQSSFVEGNSGHETDTQTCTDANPCYGWTGLGASNVHHTHPGGESKQRYLALFQPRPAHEVGERSRFVLKKMYPETDAQAELVKLGSEFINHFVIPPR